MQNISRRHSLIVLVAALLTAAIYAADAPPPLPTANFADPFPPPTTRGEPSQPRESIAFFENFEHFTSTVPGVIGKAWRAGSDDKLPVVYALPESLKKPPSTLSIEWW